MSDLGYDPQVEGGRYGNPDGPDPAAILANQEATIQANIQAASRPGTVPACYAQASAPMWASQAGSGQLPKIGWTAQNGANTPAFTPYSMDDTGITPDWTSDANPVGAGAYDTTGVVAVYAPNPLNCAPIGDGVLQYEDHPDPNWTGTDDGGHIMTEW